LRYSYTRWNDTVPDKIETGAEKDPAKTEVDMKEKNPYEYPKIIIWICEDDVITASSSNEDFDDAGDWT
jgi:hypothetical protein